MEAKRRGGRDGIRDSDRYSSLNRERDRDGDCIRDKERNDGLKSSSRCQQFEIPSSRPGSAMGMFSEPLSHSSPSSQGSGDHTQNPTVVLLHRNLDKEPGELSSGSKSDDGNGRHGSSSPVRKRKRKYSPIVWDLDDKEACQKSSKASESSKLGSRQMFCDSTSAKPCLRSPSPQPPLAPEPSSPARITPFESAEREVQATKAMSPMQEDIEELGQLDTFQRLGEEEVDDPTVPVTIAASRWSVAEEVAHSPSPVKLPPMPQHCVSMDSRDIATPSDDESQDVSMQSASTSPEPGEFVEVKDASGNDASGVKPDDNDIREDEQYEQDLNKRELMDLEENDEEEQQPELNLECEEGPCTPPQAQQRSIDMLKGCRSVDEYERLNKIDEGTYGVVYRARNKKTGEIVALKKVKMEKEREGFPMTSLREINVLLSFHHPSVVDVKEVVVGSSLDSIFMVMEYMEHDLKGLMESMKHPFSQSEVKCLMLQLFEGVKYLHDNWVLHRDLKTSNLLLNNRGELKICDFGLARQYGSPLKTYSRTVVTLWYRAPELLLGARKYSTAIDMWSLGCIMAEFLSKEPLFNGKSEIEQIDKIFRTLGTPNEKIWPDYVNLPGVKINFVRQPYNRLREKFPPTSFSGRPTLSESGFDLLNRLLTYDPLKRITVEEALKHDWFLEVPLPKMKELMPTFPVRSEHDRRLRRLMKSPDPLEEQRKRELCQGSEVGTGGLFG